jgi:hypothetical protein
LIIICEEDRKLGVPDLKSAKHCTSPPENVRSGHPLVRTGLDGETNGHDRLRGIRPRGSGVKKE